MNEVDVSMEVESLVNKAAQTKSADEALKFSQAACNSANAMAALTSARIRLRELGQITGSSSLSPNANMSPSASPSA